jgi:hypothetical protein
MAETIDPSAAARDIARLAAEDFARSGDLAATEELFGSAPVTPEKMTYPSARRKGGDFICGCTVEVDLIDTTESVDEPYVPVEHRPWRENTPSAKEKTTGRAAIAEIRKHSGK